jgi:ATP-dependent RNA helicase DDX10/DBP4
MFERKNQNVLSAHYAKLIDHSAAGFDDEADDFITLKRADHELSDAELPLVDTIKENLSKRKLKLGRAKRAVEKYGKLSRKVIFDDDGNPHDVYELGDAEDFFKDGLKGANEAGKKFAEVERTKVKERDAIDKEAVKEKKMAKKRKRQERINGVRFYTFCAACRSNLTLFTDRNRWRSFRSYDSSFIRRRWL